MFFFFALKMFRALWKMRLRKIVIPLLLCSAVALWNPSFLSFALQSIFNTIAFPAKNVLSFAAYHFRSAGSFFVSIGAMKQEYEKLLSENAELRARNATLADMERENEALRHEIGLLPRDRFRLVPAEVIGRGGSGSGGSLILNVGEQSGVRKGMAVVVDRGVFAGRIGSVAPFSSGVIAVSDPESIVNAVETATEARGIVRGEYGLGLVFDMVLQSDTIREGDEVVTSGLGGDIPKGLLVGTVIRQESSIDQLFQRATLAFPVRLDRTRFVFVVVGEKL